MSMDPELYPLTLNTDTQEIIRPNGVRMRVFPMLWRLLQFISAHPDEVISPEKVLAGAWGKEEWEDPNIITSHVSHLRKRFNIDAIETIRGYGYKLKEGSVVPLSTGVGIGVPVQAEEGFVTRAELRQVLEKISIMFEAIAGGLK